MGDQMATESLFMDAENPQILHTLKQDLWLQMHSLPHSLLVYSILTLLRLVETLKANTVSQLAAS